MNHSQSESCLPVDFGKPKHEVLHIADNF